MISAFKIKSQILLFNSISFNNLEFKLLKVQLGNIQI